MTLLARLRRAVAGSNDSNAEKRLKEISDRLSKIEDSIANLEPDIKMLPSNVRKLYLEDADLTPPYDLQ